MMLVLYIFISTVLAAFGALYLKKGANQMKKLSLFNILNKNIFSGIILYGLSTLVYLWVLFNYDLSLAYPLVSFTYVWTAFLGVKYLDEKMTLFRWLGIGLIVLGAFFVF